MIEITGIYMYSNCCLPILHWKFQYFPAHNSKAAKNSILIILHFKHPHSRVICTAHTRYSLWNPFKNLKIDRLHTTPPHVYWYIRNSYTHTFTFARNKFFRIAQSKIKKNTKCFLCARAHTTARQFKSCKSKKKEKNFKL